MSQTARDSKKPLDVDKYAAFRDGYKKPLGYKSPPRARGIDDFSKTMAAPLQAGFAKNKLDLVESVPLFLSCKYRELYDHSLKDFDDYKE